MFDEIETIERLALTSLHEAATQDVKSALRLGRETVGSAMLSVAGEAPASAIVANRAIGLGVGTAESRETVTQIVDHYRNAGVERYFVHVHPESKPDTLRDWLIESGLEKARGWMKFSRGREALPLVNTNLGVRRAQAADAPAFGRIVCDAFDLGEAAADWLAGLVGQEGWRIYMTFSGDEPAGTGAMFIHEDIAWLDWGATAPAFRRQGSQNALLRMRLQQALDLGCRMIVTTTGEEVEGDPQHSYKNILRMGFEEAYVRENYAPPRR